MSQNGQITAKEIGRLMEVLQMSHGDFAKAMGVSRASVYRWLAGGKDSSPVGSTRLVLMAIREAIRDVGKNRARLVSLRINVSVLRHTLRTALATF